MEIRPVDVHDDAQFDAFYDVLRAAHLHERPGMPTWSRHECAVIFRVPEPFETMTAYAAYAGDQVVGAGFTFLTDMDNTDKAHIIAAVAPERTRQGIGSAMVEYLIEVCSALGRTTFLSESWIPFERRDDHPYRRFAEKHGFSLANVEVARSLALPVPEKELDAWAEEAARHHREYQLQTITDDIPEPLVESFCYLVNQLALDAPTGEIDFEAESMTPDALRQREKKMRAAGVAMYTTVATDSAGTVVAQSTIGASSEDPVNMSQWATIVHRDHRGHRLGLAVKAKNLRAVQRDFPERKRVITCNAEVNRPMVAINELMGFHPVELLAEFQRKAGEA